MGSIKDLPVDAGGGNYLKTPAGATKMRIVSDVIRVWKDFDGKKLYLTEEAAKMNPDAKTRYACWCIDRADGEIKMWEFGAGVARDLKELANNQEYAFDGLPPYDIIVNRVGTTLQDTRYTLTPARQNTELTAAERIAVDAQEKLLMFLRETAEDRDSVAPF